MNSYNIFLATYLQDLDLRISGFSSLVDEMVVNERQFVETMVNRNFRQLNLGNLPLSGDGVCKIIEVCLAIIRLHINIS